MLLYESQSASVLWDEATQSVVIRKKTADESANTFAELTTVAKTDTIPSTEEWGGILQTVDAFKATLVRS